MSDDLTAIDQACNDLTDWLPVAAELTAQPDTTPAAGSHTKPGSRPPWTAGPAHAVTDIHAGSRAIENQLRHDITGNTINRGGSDGNTIAALQAIPALAQAAEPGSITWAARELARMLTAILQPPAVDLEERPQRIPAPCPYCHRPMLRVYPRSGRLTCLAYGSCTDNDGNHPIGHMQAGPASGEPYIAWADGTIQMADA